MLSSVIPGTHVALGTKVDTSDVFPLSDHERRNGLYILGRSGFGKSTLIKNLIFQDILNGHGVFFLDPTGDAIDDLLNHIPAQREKDVFVLDPADETYTF